MQQTNIMKFRTDIFKDEQLTLNLIKSISMD